MTHPGALAYLPTHVVRAFLLGCCICLGAGCTAGAYLPAAAPASRATAAEQPSSTAPEVTSTPTALPTTLAAADAPPVFVGEYVFDPEWDIEQVEFDVAPGVLPTETITDFLQLARLAYGELDTSDRAFDVQLVLKNTGDQPMPLNLDRRFFSFEDDQGRKAELIYFCCDAAGDMLAPGDTRSLHMVFRSVPGWEGKEVAAEFLLFRVRGLEPVVSAAWRILPLVTAD